MNEKEIINNAIKFMKDLLSNDGSGHDYFHMLRVTANAEKIAKHEKCNMFIVKLASLLHDVDDYKIFGGEIGEFKNAKSFMKTQGLDETIINQVCKIISEISYKGSDTQKPTSIECKIVQDADRLDAMGAIGIARTFQYGGSIKRPIYMPNIKPKLNMKQEEYKTTNNSTINHFHEKLLNLKNLMNTKTGKKLAKIRHKFMQKFLATFFNEWSAVE